MHPIGVFLTLLIVVPLEAGQNPALRGKQTPLKPADLCVIEGVVVNANTGEPVRKVWVTMLPQGGQRQQYSAQTDALGRFMISGITPGPYLLNAQRNGYPYQLYGQPRPGGRAPPVTLSPGSHLKDIVFRLRPGGIIAGAVYDEDGEPVAMANVQALRLPRGSRTRGIGTAGNAMTNDRGEYRIFNLEPGQYYVVASEQGWHPNAATEEVSIPTFYPNSADPAQAVTVQVNAGDELSGIDMNLVHVRGVRVTGRVVKPAPAKTEQGLYVQLMPRDAKFGNLPFRNYGANVQADTGAFEIGPVPPGSYVLTANWNDSGRSFFGSLPVDVVSADISGITVTLGPSIALSGRVRIDPRAQLDFTRLSMSLQPVGGAPFGGGFARVNADGSFVFDNLYDGNYRLHVGGYPEEFYVKSARLGGSEILASGVSLSRMDPPGTLEVELTLDGGRIDGTVLHEMHPVPGAFVVLIPDPPFGDRDEMYSEKGTDQLGRFSMLGLPPGNFKLFAWEPAAEVDFRDPEFVKLYEGRGTRVHIVEKQQQTVQLELIQAIEGAK